MKLNMNSNFDLNWNSSGQSVSKSQKLRTKESVSKSQITKATGQIPRNSKSEMENFMKLSDCFWVVKKKYSPKKLPWVR